MKNFEEAIKFYDKAIFINSNNENYYSNKAEALKNLFKLEEAFLCLDKAI